MTRNQTPDQGALSAPILAALAALIAVGVYCRLWGIDDGYADGYDKGRTKGLLEGAGVGRLALTGAQSLPDQAAVEARMASDAEIQP